MAWIELHQALPNHRKTLALADVLGIAPVYALGHLTAFWLWSIDNAPDGSLSGITPRVIAFAAQWPGEPAVLVDALVSSGFLDQDDQGLTIHDWMDYAGQLVERRQAERERSRKRRASYISTTAGRPAVDQQTAVGTVPYPTVPNRTLPDHVPTYPVAPATVKETAPRPKKAATKPIGPQAAMFAALQEEYGDGREDIPLNDSERRIFGKVAGDLVKSELLPTDVHTLRENIRNAYPNLGTIPPTMLSKYVYLLRSPPRPTNGSRAVDRSALAGTVDYAKLHDLKEARERGVNGEAARSPG